VDEGLTVDVDPLASMRCWAIEVELGGRTYDVPALSAIDWWPVLTSANPLTVLDIFESSDVDDRLLSGELEHTEMIGALREVIEEAAGRSFHAAVVLAMVANTQWPVINGALVQRGFRWEGQPLGAVLDAIYAVVTTALEKDARDKFLAVLENEGLTNGKPTKRQREKLASEFETMAGPRPTQGVKSTGGPSDSGRPRTQPRLQRPRQGGLSREPTRRRGPRAGSGPAASS
jgi:hypothetical protein